MYKFYQKYRKIRIDIMPNTKLNQSEVSSIIIIMFAVLEVNEVSHEATEYYCRRQNGCPTIFHH